MSFRSSTFLVVSAAFWAAAGLLVLVAMIGPCGLAPDERCELEGGGRLGFVDGVSPVIVLIVAVSVYLAAVLLIRRARKVV